MGFENYKMTGGMAEDEAFGEPKETLSFDEFKQKYPQVRYNPEEERQSKQQAMQDVRSIQKNQKRKFGNIELEVSPTDPQKLFAKKLRQAIVEQLQVADEGRILFHTAVHTVLDYRFGIDAFIDVELDDERRVTVTFDITKNPHKESGKADIIFQYPGYDLEEEEDKVAFQKKIDAVSQEAVRVIREKLSEEDMESLATREAIS